MSKNPRLPKQFWRVVVMDGRLGRYELGGKTYSVKVHAENQVAALARKGVTAHLFTTGPVSWTQVSAPKPEDMDTLW